MKSLLIFVATLALTACVTDPASTPKNKGEAISAAKTQSASTLLDTYSNQSNALLEDIRQGKTPKITTKASGLTELGRQILLAYKDKNADCSAYIDAALKLRGQLATISIDDLENKYHLDGALPKADKKCYHVKDLYIHPATVVVLMRNAAGNPKKATRQQMEAEILEANAHIRLVRSNLK